MMRSTGDLETHPVMISEQFTIQMYNESILNKKDLIPLVPRNGTTGWPLLQISLITANPLHPEAGYSSVLGGGRCHDLSPAHYCFALLLCQITGAQCKIDGNHVTAKEMANLQNIILMGGGYSVKLSHPSIRMSNTHGPYGFDTCIGLVGDKESGNNLDLALSSVGQYCDFLNDALRFGSYSEESESVISGDEIRMHLREGAIFHDGQIYIDFKQFLETHDIKANKKEIFAYLFKVDSFLKVHSGELTPATYQASEESIIPLNIDSENDEPEDNIIIFTLPPKRR